MIGAESSYSVDLEQLKRSEKTHLLKVKVRVLRKVLEEIKCAKEVPYL